MNTRHHSPADHRLTIIVLAVLISLISACSASTPPADTVATEVARSVAATMAAQPAAAQPVTSAPEATMALTTTPALTDTPVPIATATRISGIGDLFECGADWTLRIVKQPLMGKDLEVHDPGGYDSFQSRESAKGTWLYVLLEITNMHSETDDINSYDDEMFVRGMLNGREVRFTPNRLSGPSLSQEEAGISDWSDDIPPGVTLRATAMFDINPAATDLTLVLDTSVCRVDIPLIDTRQVADRQSTAEPSPTQQRTTKPTPTQQSTAEPSPTQQRATDPGATEQGAAPETPSSDQPVVLVGAKNVNLRAGPGTVHPVAGQALANTRYPVVGRNADSSWWQVTVNGKTAWVAASVVTALGPVSGVKVAQSIPTPPPAPPTKAPVVLPKTVPLGQEFPTTLWGLKLYDVKRAKVVYWYGTAEIAQGTWLIPFVEVRNLGSGTAQPHKNLHFYLQDERGRTFTYDPFNDAVLGAAWQFKAGHLYDDINPGSVLGIALPFDVTPELGDIWLRVKEAPEVVMYLGNVSQMPESK